MPLRGKGLVHKTRPLHKIPTLYRIAGKFGGRKVWRIGHLEVLARKSLANVDDLEDEEVDPNYHGNLAGFNWQMTCNFAKLFPHQTFALYGTL